jgi:hypothetical protein
MVNAQMQTRMTVADVDHGNTSAIPTTRPSAIRIRLLRCATLGLSANVMIAQHPS